MEEHELSNELKINSVRCP